MQSLLGIPGISKPLVIRIGVTGHKDLVSRILGRSSEGFNDQRLEERLTLMVQAVMDYLDRLLVHTPRKYLVVSPLAEGGDIVLTDGILSHAAAPELNLAEPPQLYLIQPMPDARYLEEFVSEAQRDAYRRLKGRAINLGCAPLVPKADTPDERSRAHKLVINAVVEECDILLAVWDGLATKKSAGTAATVAEARRLGKPVIHLCPSRSLLRYVERFALPLIAKWPRSAWLFKGFGIRVLDGDSSLAALEHLDSFNEDLQRQTSSDKRSALHLQDSHETAKQVRDVYVSVCEPLTNDPAAMKEFEGTYGLDLQQMLLPIWRKTASLARRYQRYYNRVMGTAIYLLAASAVVTVAVITSFFPSKYYLYWMEVVEAAGILALLVLARQFAWHRKRIEYRILSERLRAAIFLHISGMKAEKISVPPYLKGSYGASRWTIEIFNKLTEHMRGDITWPTKHFETFRNLVVKSWIGNQLEYYKHQAKRQRRRYELLEISGLLTFAFTVVIAVIHALGITEDHRFVNSSLSLMALSLPAAGGAMAGILAHREYRRNAHRYQQMANALVRILAEAQATKEMAAFQRAFQEAYHLMLREQQTWLSTVGMESPPPV